VAGAARQTSMVIENRLSEFRRVEAWLAELAEAWVLPPQTAFAVDLVVNEAVTNTISYGYQDAATHEISIRLTDSADAVEIEISDDARPFDPFSLPPMVIGTDLAEASIGGRGIHLIKTYTDERRYSFISGRNHLKLRVSKSP
jgi:anti-sigma regulatory factor (Ser/Thr protein kinase)